MAKFNSQRVKDQAQRKRIKGGVHSVVCVGADVHPSDKNNLMVVLDLKVIKDHNDPNTIVNAADARTWLTLPLDNEEVEGHEAPEWAIRGCVPWFATMFDDCKDYPRKLRKGKNEPFYFDGEEIEREEYAACRDEAIDSVGEKACEVWDNQDFGGFVGKPFYMKVTYKENSDFPNLYPSLELLEGWEDSLVPAEDENGKLACLEVPSSSGNVQKTQERKKPATTGGRQKRQSRRSRANA